MDDEKALMKSIIQTNNELKIAFCNFESAEGEMIDYYSYQIKANKAKLDYLFRKVKNAGKSLNMIEQIKLKNNIKEAV